MSLGFRINQRRRQVSAATVAAYPGVPFDYAEETMLAEMRAGKVPAPGWTQHLSGSAVPSRHKPGLSAQCRRT